MGLEDQLEKKYLKSRKGDVIKSALSLGLAGIGAYLVGDTAINSPNPVADVILYGGIAGLFAGTTLFAKYFYHYRKKSNEIKKYIKKDNDQNYDP